MTTGRTLALGALLLLRGVACAQDVGVAVVGATMTPLPSPYAFTDTPVGEATTVVLQLQNKTQSPMEIVSVVIGNSAGSAIANSNFSVTGLVLDKTLAASSASFENINVTFTPTSQGENYGYLTIVYELQQSGCTLGGSASANPCAAETADGGTLQGNATAPVFVVSYQGTAGQVEPQPFSSTPINFGNVSTSGSAALTFSITNQSGAAISAPGITLSNAVFASSAFALDTSSVPATLDAGVSAPFTVKFEPGQVAQANATLLVGSLVYNLTGTGAVVTAIDGLEISCVDSQGVRTYPQAATPISFGQVVAGAGGSTVLTFTITNPITSAGAIQLPSLTVTGSAFTAANVPTMPDTLQPGQSLSFTITFAPSAKGNATGTLSIGTRVFALAGSSVSSDVPQATLQVDVQPLTSQLQANLSIQFPSPSPESVVGQLTMTFAPSVANVTDDPAVLFLATNTRTMQVSVAAGALSASYDGQTSLAFQTGTTAGTITFTVTFPDQAPVTASYTIDPEKVQIASATAVRQAPYLVVTINAFDNTYSAGTLSFTFNDLNGNPLTSTPIAVNESAAFSKYFFNNDTAGGAFALQAQFPVTGDVTQVGSVTVQVSNSAGTSTVTETFD